ILIQLHIWLFIMNEMTVIIGLLISLVLGVILLIYSLKKSKGEIKPLLSV
ncbi:hypothetical protein LCGC14_0860080, partial [marine sediment metagenome]